MTLPAGALYVLAWFADVALLECFLYWLETARMYYGAGAPLK